MKQRICIIAINDRWNTQFIHILREECDVMFQFKVNILSILPKTVEISHEWVLKIFKYQEPEFYARLFDESEEVPFEVPPRFMDVAVIRKPVLGATNLYFSVNQE